LTLANGVATLQYLNATSNNIAVSLAFTGARAYFVKRTDGTANTVTLTPSSGTIEGAASYALAPNEGIFLTLTGTDYKILASYGAIPLQGNVFATGNTALPASTVETLVTSPSLPIGTYVVSGWALLDITSGGTLGPIDLIIQAGTATISPTIIAVTASPSALSRGELAVIPAVTITVTAAGTIVLAAKAGSGVVNGTTLYQSSVGSTGTATGMSYQAA
jgi:hypothetical protein